MGSGKGSGKGDDEVEFADKEHSPRWKVLAYEIVLVVMAIVSIQQCYAAFVKIKNASSDVNSIVANWNLKPIQAVEWPGGGLGCSAGFEKVYLPKFPGVENGGCGCEFGSTYELSSGGSKPASSSSDTPCLTNQTGNALYRCATIGGLPSYENEIWQGDQLCIKRGFKAAVDTPYPDSSTGECPAGFHKCGTGNFDDKRAFCASDDSTGCPLTWMAGADVMQAAYVFRVFLPTVLLVLGFGAVAVFLFFR